MNLYNRLREYEATGLEPEQIIRARDTLECFDNIGIKRGNEIVKAEQEGRLVVLPCTLLAAFVLKLPLPFVYLSTRIDQCYKWIIAFFRLRGDKWIHNVTRDDKGAKA